MKFFKQINTLAVLIVLLFSANAFAFDGYEDRRGVFVGFGLGGGLGGVDVENATDDTGLDTPAMGFHADAAFGTGITQSLTASVQGNVWIRTVKLNDFELRHQHFSILPTVDYFLFEGLNMSLGTGLAYATFDTLRDEESTYLYRELGLAVKLGTGYEFFANGTIAAGVQLGYTTHVYSHGMFNTLTGGVRLRWY